MGNVAEDLVIIAIYVAPFAVALVVASWIAERVLGRWPRVTRFVEQLFDIDLTGNEPASQGNHRSERRYRP